MSADTSLRDSAARGVVWSTVHVWGTHAIQLGIMLVLARLLEPRDFGLFAMAQVVLALIQALTTQGIPDALVQADESDNRTLWSTGLLAVTGAAITAACLLWLSAPLVARMFGEPALRSLVVWMAPSVVFHGVYSMTFARARDRLLFGAHARAGVAGAAAAFVAGVPVAFAGHGVWALVAAAYAGQIVETGLLIRAAGWVPIAGFDGAGYRRLFRFGRHIVGGALTTFLNRRADDYFIGLFLGASALGIYAIAYRVLELLTTVFLRAIDRVAFPVFAKLKESPQLLADGVRTSFRFTSLLAFPTFAGALIVAPDLLTVVLGDAWIDAAGPLRILALGGIGLCIVNVLPSAVRAMGYPQWNVAISAIQGVVMAAAYAVAARSGIEAVAWVFTAGTLLVFPLFFAATTKLIPLRLGSYLSEGGGPLAATLVMGTGVWGVVSTFQSLSPTVRLAAGVVAGIVVYVAAVMVLARPHARELLQRIRSLREGERQN